MRTARRPLAILASALIALISIAGLALWHDLDLFGVALLAIYSSVFIFLSLLSLYFVAPSHTPAAAPASSSLALLIGALVCFAGAGFFSADPSPIFFTWQDLFGSMGDEGTQTVLFTHVLFYRLCSWETLLLNAYLLLGVIVGVCCLGLVGGDRGGFKRRLWQAFGRASRGLWALKNWRLRGASRQRRQARHKNSSFVRFKR